MIIGFQDILQKSMYGDSPIIRKLKIFIYVQISKSFSKVLCPYDIKATKDIDQTKGLNNFNGKKGYSTYFQKKYLSPWN